MTIIETALTTPICPKCGSSVQVRQRKANSGDFVTIMQCVVCKFFRTISSEQ